MGLRPFPDYLSVALKVYPLMNTIYLLLFIIETANTADCCRWDGLVQSLLKSLWIKAPD